MQLRSFAIIIVTVLMARVPLAYAQDAIDSRVTFTIADDNVFKGPQQTVTGSPSIPNFQPTNANRLFFENYETRFSGFENLSHLVLYSHKPGFFAGLDTESALVLRAQVIDERTVSLLDSGSYIKISKLINGNKLALTAFPMSADRFRLGYSYNISWGGSPIFKNAKAVPGMRFEFERPGVYAFLGVKTGLGQIDESDGTKEMDTVWGVLGGAGYDVTDSLRVESNGGYFYRGTIDKQELRVSDGQGRYKTAPWLGYGGSFQVVYHQGISIGVPIDFRLYRNDPLVKENFFKRETYNDGLSYALQSEFSILGQTLQDSARPTSTTNQTAMAGDISAKVKYGKLRFNVLGVMRTLEFLLYNVPSNPSFVEFPKGITPKPDYFLSAGVDYYVESWHFTPGFILGIQRPAHQLNAVSAGNNPPASAGQQAFVYRSATQVDILDPGEKVQLIYAAKTTFRIDLSESLATIGELQYSYDRNRRTFDQDPTGIPTRSKEDPSILGFNLLLQSRF